MAKPEDVLVRLGKRVRRLREAAGESQEAFANRVGLARSYFGRVERGTINVSLLTLERIAAGLGVPMWKLLRFPE